MRINMKTLTTLIAVRDMEKSLKFYHDILEQDVRDDFGTNKVLSGGLCLQTLSSWATFINREESGISFGGGEFELYFETDDMEAFAEKLEAYGGISYVHPVSMQSWGQRSIRIYDPDNHIIEIGENMDMVVSRIFGELGTIELAAARMDVSPEYVRVALARVQKN